MTSCLDPSDDDHHLARAAAQGDSRSLTELLARLEPKLLRYCRARINAAQSTDASAEDVVQEVLMAVLAVLPNHHAGGAAFEAYAFGIARRKVADFHRRTRRATPTATGELPDTADGRPGPAECTLDAERRRRMGELLGRLSQAHQDVLTLRIVCGLSAVETAHLLDSTPGAVRVAQHRALQKLRRLLEERGDRP